MVRQQNSTAQLNHMYISTTAFVGRNISALLPDSSLVAANSGT